MTNPIFDHAARELIDALTVTVGGPSVLRPILSGPLNELRAAMQRGAAAHPQAGQILAGLAAKDDRELATVAATAAVRLLAA
jgi:hypothetical protein